MRKLIFAINISLDGCCDHTKFNPDEEILDYFTQLTREADTFVYGRTTYELMVPFWPDMAKDNSGSNADNEFAQAFAAVSNIIVFSRSLDKANERNTTIVRTGLQAEILKLKQETGKNILTGGLSIPSQLTELGLIDEYRFVVHPVIAGAGRRLFDSANLIESQQLKLAETKIFKSGGVALRYVKTK